MHDCASEVKPAKSDRMFAFNEPIKVQNNDMGARTPKFALSVNEQEPVATPNYSLCNQSEKVPKSDF